MSETKRSYSSLKQQVFAKETYSIVPIREQDRYEIMKWRNEQIYHLRQVKPLTKKDQDAYFDTVIQGLFKQKNPSQILFSFLQNKTCIGYGGLVHINWVDKNAEISFVMNTSLEKRYFQKHWVIFLGLLEKVAFQEINLYKIYTYAFDLRPQLYTALESAGFVKEAVLKEHCKLDNEYRDVIVHSKWNRQEKISLRKAKSDDAEMYFEWVNDSLVRSNALQSKPILWDDHFEWFNSKVNSKNTKLFVMLSNNIPIGQIRFDLNEMKEWIIDYSISASYRGNGYGKKIVLLGLDELSPGSIVKAIVKQENTPSMKVFDGLGFKKSAEGFNDKNYIVFELIKK